MTRNSTLMKAITKRAIMYFPENKELFLEFRLQESLI